MIQKIDEKKLEIGLKAFEAWKAANNQGTVEMTTGSGKTFVAFHAISSLKEGSKVAYLYEALDRKNDVLSQMEFYKSIYNIDLNEKYDIFFMTYQKAYRLKNKFYDLVVADEIHDSLTPVYFSFYEMNSFDKILGMSAFIEDVKYDVYSKKYYLDSIAPICFKYDLSSSLKDNVSRKLNINIIYLNLNESLRIVKAGNKSKKFYVTEKQYYDYLSKGITNSFLSNDSYLFKLLVKKRNELLYKTHAKKEALKNLETFFAKKKEKSIIFANSIDFLESVCDFVVSSRNGTPYNENLIERFNADKIRIIGSFKKLKQGINLNKVDNVVITSYYGKDKDFIQRIGRLRKNEDKVGNVIIFVTKNTTEEKTLSKIKFFDNFELNYYNSIQQYISSKNDNNN